MGPIEDQVREAAESLLDAPEEDMVLERIRRVRSRRSRARRARLVGVVAIAAAVSLLGVTLAGRAFRRPAADPPVPPRLSGNGLISFTSHFNRTSTSDVREPLYLLDWYSGEFREALSGPATGTSWSPDGTHLAYASFDRSDLERPHQLIVSRPDGSERRILLRRPGLGPIYDIGWSPDGARIAMVLSDVPPEAGDRFSEADLLLRIYVMDRDGSDLRALTPETEQVTSFDWSPDGTRIAYTLRSLQSRTRRFDHDLYVMNRDGSGVRALTQDHRSLGPAWSPDGTSIAFLRYDGEDFQGRDVMVMASTGASARLLTRTPQTEDQPVWSPDGTQLLFARFNRGSGCSLVTYDLESGRERTELVEADIGGCFSGVAWQPVTNEAALSQIQAAIAGLVEQRRQEIASAREQDRAPNTTAMDRRLHELTIREAELERRSS